MVVRLVRVVEHKHGSLHALWCDPSRAFVQYLVNLGLETHRPKGVVTPPFFAVLGQPGPGDPHAQRLQYDIFAVLAQPGPGDP